MGVTQLGYLGFGVSDMDAWELLLKDQIGLQISSRGESGELCFRMDHYFQRILVQPTGEDDVIFVGWEVATPDDLDELAGQLRDAGIDVSVGDSSALAERRVQGLIRFVDPEGLETEAFWGPLVCSDPFLPSQPMTGFMAGELGLGHVVVATRDRATTQSFYTDVLGFRLSDYGSGALAFLRCNARHHSIALAPPLGPKRVVHFMVEMQSLDDVGVALDRCADGGSSLSTTLGKHVNDYVVSFYVSTPSGFDLECGWNGRLVNESSWQVHRYGSRNVWGHREVD